MSSARQPLLTLSPSQHACVSPSNTDDFVQNSTTAAHPPQTTPTLPRRERLASFSRLLKKDRFSEFTKNLKKTSSNSNENSARCSDGFNKSSVEIRVSPCSPPEEQGQLSVTDKITLESGKGFLSPNQLPFSPKLLSKRSPINLSPNYRHPSPLRSPLYQPDNSKNFLGRGSFGKVSLCKFKDTAFAMKVVYNPSQYIGEKHLLGIRHPHLVEIFHISIIFDKTLIFMEFAGNCNLQQILNTKSELDLRRKLSFCAQIASGLRHCHQHLIVHGDVKPANVMISPLGICKLGDFGHSVSLDVTQAGELPHRAEDIVGTAAYAAPEILKGSSPTSYSDMYSFGILLWQVETREIPFAGEHPHVIIYKVANYGERPKFSKDSSPVKSLYIETAENCWRTVPQERIDASQALLNIQNIMQKVKQLKEN